MSLQKHPYHSSFVALLGILAAISFCPLSLAIASTKAPHSLSVLPNLTDLCKDPQPEHLPFLTNHLFRVEGLDQMRVIGALTQFNDESALVSLLAFLQLEESKDAMADALAVANFSLPVTRIEVCCCAVEALGAFEDKRSYTALVEALACANPFLRMAAVKALVRHFVDQKSVKAKDLLMLSLNDSDARVRALVLTRIRPFSSVEIGTNQSTPNPFTKDDLLDIVSLTKDVSSEVRLRAVEALPFWYERVFHILPQMLSDRGEAFVDPLSFSGTWQVRAGVARRIGESSDARYLSVLQKSIVGWETRVIFLDQRPTRLPSGIYFYAEAAFALAMLGDIDGLALLVTIDVLSPESLCFVRERRGLLQRVWPENKLGSLIYRQGAQAWLASRSSMWLYSTQEEGAEQKKRDELGPNRENWGQPESAD